MALLAGGDDLGLRRLALPVGQLLGAGIDQQGDRVGALAAGELRGQLAQQRRAGLRGSRRRRAPGGRARPAAAARGRGRSCRLCGRSGGDDGVSASPAPRRARRAPAPAGCLAARSLAGGCCRSGRGWRSPRCWRSPPRGWRSRRRRATRDRRRVRRARRRWRSLRSRGGRLRRTRAAAPPPPPEPRPPPLAVGELLDQLVAGQHAVALDAGLGGQRVQLGQVLGLQFGLVHGRQVIGSAGRVSRRRPRATRRGRCRPRRPPPARPRASCLTRAATSPARRPSPRRPAGPSRRSRSCGAASSPRRVRRRSTSATVRACSRRAATTASASRSGRPSTIGAASFGSSRGELQHRRGPRARSGRRAASSASSPTPSGASRSSGAGRHPERDLGGVAGRLAALALDQAVDGLLRHPPPGRQLAAGDRQHPGGGLVELGLAGDVDRLLRVAGRDQRPHAGVGADQVRARRARRRRSR